MLKEGIFETPIEGVDRLDYFSASKAKLLAQEAGAAKFKAKYIDGLREEFTEAKHFGKILDKAVTEPEKFRERYVVQPYRKNSNAYKDWIKDLDPDVIILKQKEAEHIEGMVKSLLAHPGASKLLSNCVRQACGYYQHEDGNWTMFRPDLIKESNSLPLDIKTTADARQHKFESQMFEYGYDIQASVYIDGINKIYGTNHQKMGLIIIEKKPPYLVALREVNQAAMDLGRRRYEMMRRWFLHCKKNNDWPGYGNRAKPIGVPNWAYDVWANFEDTLPIEIQTLEENIETGNS